jgi:hypothetical protein
MVTATMSTMASLLVSLCYLVVVHGHYYAVFDEDYSCYHQYSWLTNQQRLYDSQFLSFTDITHSQYVPPTTRRLADTAVSTRDINVQVLDTSSTGWTVSFAGIPSYTHQLTTADMETLTSRPLEVTDFTTGQPAVVAGQTVKFGADIGFRVANCSLAFWPPAIPCPIPSNYSKLFTLTPAPESDGGGENSLLCTS